MKTNTTNIIGIIVGIGVILSVMFFAISNSRTQVANGSTIQGSDYSATTTDSNWSGVKLIKTGQGSLGSVVVTLGSGASLELYDATTTSSHSNHATTSIAMFNTTATAGTYTFDVSFSRGLVAVMNSTAGVASTTITFR